MEMIYVSSLPELNKVSIIVNSLLWRDLFAEHDKVPYVKHCAR